MILLLAEQKNILKGIEGAKIGGFLAIGVEDLHSAFEKEFILEYADIYIKSWKELLEEELESSKFT